MSVSEDPLSDVFLNMLYRKYRPKLFSEMVGQEHVIRSLKGGLSSARISHAYLFAGSRGTGKTTVARIFAKALNCLNRSSGGEPDNTCDSCVAINSGASLALVEIDAASNRGIDEIRSIKESATVAALGGIYKIFLVDEAHMLTKDAFNALLKILEEPPSHVIFILATTEPHKIIQTVLSRVQRFDFKRLTEKEIASKLKSISLSEKLNIEDASLATIASSADGALRDAEVSLSKVVSVSNRSKEISEQDVQHILGLVPTRYYPEFLGYLVSSDCSSAISFIQRIHESGIDPEYFSKGFTEYLRRVLLMHVDPATLVAAGVNMTEDHEQLLKKFATLIEPRILVSMLSVFSEARNAIKTSPIPQLPLELAVMEIIDKQSEIA